MNRITQNIILLRSYNIYLGSRVGAVVRALASHQCVPGSIPGPGVICGLSLLLVLCSAPRGFSPGTPVFPSHQKPTLLNSNSIWKQWMKSQWMKKCHCKFLLLLLLLLFSQQRLQDEIWIYINTFRSILVGAIKQ